MRLQVFDILGRKIRDLVENKSQAAGQYTVEWDGVDDLGRAVSSGVYYYGIEAGDFVESHKMVLLK